MFLAIVRFLGTDRRIYLALGGVALGCAGLTKPEFFVASLAAVVVWLAVRARREGFRAADALALLVPAAAVVAAVYGFFLTRVSLHTLVYVNLYPVRELRAAADVALRAHAPLTMHSFIVIAGRLVLYAAGCAVLMLVGRVLGRTRRITLAWGICAFAALVLVAASFADPEALRTRPQVRVRLDPGGSVDRDRVACDRDLAAPAGLGYADAVAAPRVRVPRCLQRHGLRQLLHVRAAPADGRLGDAVRCAAARRAAPRAARVPRGAPGFWAQRGSCSSSVPASASP